MSPMLNEKNLTDPIDIRYAIERKGGGRGSLTRLAKKIKTHRESLSMNISGTRRQEAILKHIATYIGQPVHGVEPETCNH